MKFPWNDFLDSLKEIFSKYKKMIIKGAFALLGIIILLVIISSIIAMWDQAHAIYYEVTFETNGGTIISAQKVRKGKTLKEGIQTEKVGFDLVGWSYQGEVFDMKTPITENMELSAIWKSNGSTIVHTVSFETYGGSIIEDIEVSEGRTFTKPKDPEKEGYSFLGWYWNEEQYDFMKTGVPSDLTLRAKWKRNFPLAENEAELERSNYLFSQIEGIWYLKGYEDVYLEISEEDNGFGEQWYFVKWYNIDLFHNFKLYSRTLYQRTFSSEKTEFYQKMNKFRCSLQEENLIFEYSGKYYTFVTEKGSKNKYTDTIYEKAVGRWYLENSYSSYIDITAIEQENILNYNTYCITTTNINLGTLQLGSSINYGCLKAYDESLFQDLGIQIEQNVMTVRNEFGSRRFTQNKIAEEGSVTGIKIDKVAANIAVGNKITLFATVMPKEALNTKVSWSSSDSSIVEVVGNPNIITVGSEGTRYSAIVTAKNPGTATITVTTADGEYMVTSKITVPAIEMESIVLNKTETTIYVGNFEQLKAKITPSNASEQKLLWSSSAPEIASVSETGNIQALKEGTATIVAMSEDGKKKATCTVTVKYPILKVVTAMTETTKMLDGNYVNGISVVVTPSGGSGSFRNYQIKLYYNHQLVQEGTEATLFYPTDLSGNYYAEVTVIDSAGHQMATTKEYIKK